MSIGVITILLAETNRISMATQLIKVIIIVAGLSMVRSLESSQSCPIDHSCWETSNPFMPCPVGFFCHNSSCTELGRDEKKLKSIIKYSNKTTTMAARILDCYCMTYDEHNTSLTVGACSYNCNPGQPMYVSLGLNYSNLNEIMCSCDSHNRRGTMCKDCRNNTFPTLYSYSSACTKCATGKWETIRHILQYMAFAYLPLTVLTLLVFLLKVNVTSSHLHGFILFSQIISIPAVIRILLDKQVSKNVRQIIKVFSIILGISNLDFFRAYTGFICLPNINVFVVLVLDYVVAALPLVFIGFSYVAVKLYERNFRLVIYIWYPFRYILLRLRQNWEIQSTIADAYCTFFLLSFMKFLSVSFDFLIPTKVFVIQSSGSITSELRLFYEASNKYFGTKHLPFAIIAIIVLAVFVISPIIVTFLYQFLWFQKALSFFPSLFHESVSRFQDCYKDGKQKGTRDYRWFSGMFLVLRIIVFVSFAATPTYLYFVLSSIYILVFSLIMLLLQPFKEEYSHYLSVNLFFTTLLALVYISLAGLKIATVKSQKHIHSCYYMAAFFTTASLLYITLYAAYWLYSRRRIGFKWKFSRKMFVRQKGYGSTVQEEIEGSFPDRIQNPNRYDYENMGSFVTHEKPLKEKGV